MVTTRRGRIEYRVAGHQVVHQGEREWWTRRGLNAVCLPPPTRTRPRTSRRLTLSPWSAFGAGGHRRGAHTLSTVRSADCGGGAGHSAGGCGALREPGGQRHDAGGFRPSALVGHPHIVSRCPEHGGDVVGGGHSDSGAGDRRRCGGGRPAVEPHPHGGDRRSASPRGRPAKYLSPGPAVPAGDASVPGAPPETRPGRRRPPERGSPPEVRC